MRKFFKTMLGGSDHADSGSTTPGRKQQLGTPSMRKFGPTKGKAIGESSSHSNPGGRLQRPRGKEVLKPSKDSGKQKEDLVMRVTFAQTRDEQKPTDIEVNLNYEYNYDDIKLVWNHRLPILVDWCTRVAKVPSERQIPILMPDYEIHLGAQSGEVGSLSFYLEHHLLGEEDRRIKAKQACDREEHDELDELDGLGEADTPQGQRLVIIPMNTGGHWVTLMLYVGPSNKINSAIYIDSIVSKRQCQTLLNAIAPEEVVASKDRAQKILAMEEDELHSKLNIASKQAKSTPFPDHVLSSTKTSRNPEGLHPITQEIKLADPTFPGQVYRRFNLIQFDSVACGPFSIENGIECVKAAYLGADHVFRPQWYNEGLTAQIRAHHVMALGVDDPFNDKQRHNRQNADGGMAHVRRMQQMYRPEVLNPAGELIVQMAMKLHPTQKALLAKVLYPEDTSAHMEHSDCLLEIRKVLIGIKNAFLLEIAELEREAKEGRDVETADSTSLAEEDPLLASKLASKREDLNVRIDAFDTILKTITAQQLTFEILKDAVLENTADLLLPIELDGEFEQLQVVGRYLKIYIAQEQKPYGQSSHGMHSHYSYSSSSRGTSGYGSSRRPRSGYPDLLGGNGSHTYTPSRSTFRLYDNPYASTGQRGTGSSGSKSDKSDRSNAPKSHFDRGHHG